MREQHYSVNIPNAAANVSELLQYNPLITVDYADL